MASKTQAVLTRYLIPIPLAFILLALVLEGPFEAFRQLFQLVQTYAPGVHDYYETVGFSGTILNAGLVGLLSLFLFQQNKLAHNANTISTLFLMMGFSFIGKNVLNCLPFIAGGYLYAKWQGIPFKRVLIASMLATCLAPLVDLGMMTLPYAPLGKIILSSLIGIMAGMVAIPIASHLLVTHQGYNLYNMGFSAGFIGIVAIAVIKGYGIDTSLLSIVSDQGSDALTWLLVIIFIYFLILGKRIKQPDDPRYKEILWYSGRLVSDFTRLLGPGNALMNMGIMGFIGLGFVLLFKVAVSGPVVAGMMTLTGFATFGNQPKNTLPIMIGAMGGVVFLHGKLSITAGVIATLFATTMAPIAGEYGMFAGVAVGVLHTSIVSSMSGLHGALNLYNNGFSGGLIASLAVPVIDAFKKERKA